LNKTILAVDVGSSETSVIIAEVTPTGKIEITGHGQAKAQGVKKGIITNIELASRSIKKALGDARRISGSNISVATVSISNAYAKSIHSSGIVNIPHKDISLKEINRVMETALYNSNIPNEYEVIHVLPYNFKVDDQSFIEDPYGMNASRLEVDTNIILTQKSSLSNLTKAVRSAGLDIESVVLNSYASAISTMNEDEKELGVCVIDMGGQTSNMVIQTGNAIRYNDFIPVGSNHITNDLSMALHTPLRVAEDVKREFGDLTDPDNNEVIELPIIGDEESKNSISVSIVHSVISSRIEELLMLLEKSFDKSGLRDQIGSGIILTGGMTKLKGVREYAQAVFHGIPVRIGFPRKLGGLYDELTDPTFATVMGLLLYRVGEHTQYEVDNAKRLLHNKHEGEDDEDTLNDIKLGNKPKNHKIQATSNFANKPTRTKPNKKQIQDDGDFAIMDLPDPSGSEQGMMSKFGNWLKQLF